MVIQVYKYDDFEKNDSRSCTKNQLFLKCFYVFFDYFIPYLLSKEEQ
jgi:hypothetical protein